MLLERDAELTRLHGPLAEVGETGGRVMLVRGEAGIGKTALVHRFLSGIEEQAHILLGECGDLLAPEPLGPLWDLARHEAALAEPLAGGDRCLVMETLLDLLSRTLRPTVVALASVSTMK